MLTNRVASIIMPSTQSALAGTVISFALHAARVPPVAQGSCLTPQDRMQVGFWQDRARQAGYDRMVIHDRDEGDASEVGNFLSVYLRGQAWSRWGFARSGAYIRAWCCLTGADVGEFTSINEAMTSVLRGIGDVSPREPDGGTASNLIHLSFPKRVGSAA